MIYLDYASSTPVNLEVLEEMEKYFVQEFANASSSHRYGKKTFAKIDEMREIIASSIGADADEIYFTSSATESNNWVMKSSALSALQNGKKPHIITSRIEHSSIFECCEFLCALGCEIDYVDIDKNGFVDLEQLEKCISSNTVLISIIFANNEIGTIQPIEKISDIAKKHGIPFHTDAVQFYCKEDIDVKQLGIDMMSISSHKIYGPKGIAALYLRKGILLSPLLHGGHQEHSMRAGTSNTPAILGFGMAVQKYLENRERMVNREYEIRNRIHNALIKELPIIVNGDMEKRLCNNLNISIQGIDHNKLMALLDFEGICVSTGSACSSGEIRASRVIEALNRSGGRSDIDGAIRITCSYLNSEEEIDLFIHSFIRIAKKLMEKKSIEKSFN